MAEVPMVTALRRHAEERPDAPAVTVDDITVTFAELDQRTEVIGHALAREGIGPSDRVTIALPNSHAFMATVIATLKLGATPQPIAARLPRAEAASIIALADPKLVIGADPHDHPGRRCITDLTELCVAPHDEPLPRLPPRVSSQWKVTTSGGSTGRPKLIVGTAPAVVDEAAPPDYLLPTDSVVLIPGPLYHTAPYAISVLALVHGNHLLLQSRFNPETTAWLIDRYRPTFALLVPTMMQRIWRLPTHVRDVDMTSLRTVFHMASHCPAWLKRAWIDWLGPDRIFELYGASDSATNTVIGGREWLEHPGSVGRVRGHTRPGQGETMITDDTGRELGPGEVGEIWMRPAPGSTPRSIVIGAQPRERDGWVSVGDLGWIDADGYLYIAERRTDLIVTGGENVYAAEVEGALDSHPGVRSSVVIGLPDDDLGQRVHALVEVRDGVTEADLRAHMRGQLARYKTPRSYELLDHPLRDDAGKVRKSALVAARSAGSTEGAVTDMSWDALAAELADARRRGRTVTPPSQRFTEFGLADGYAVGRLLTERRAADGRPPTGIKIGLTNSAVWPRLEISHPVWAPVFSAHAAGEFRLTGLTAPRLEVEFVTGLAAPLPTGSPVERVVDAIGWVALGFEIVDCHYPDWKLTPADLVADHGVHVALVLGPRRTVSAPDVAGLAELPVTLHRDGQEIARGSGRDVLGGPAASIAALSAAPFGRDLDAGEVISTGALTGGAHPVAAGQTWAADVPGFPRLEVTLS